MEDKEEQQYNISDPYQIGTMLEIYNVESDKWNTYIVIDRDCYYEYDTRPRVKILRQNDLETFNTSVSSLKYWFTNKQLNIIHSMEGSNNNRSSSRSSSRSSRRRTE